MNISQIQENDLKFMMFIKRISSSYRFITLYFIKHINKENILLHVYNGYSPFLNQYVKSYEL